MLGRSVEKYPHPLQHCARRAAIAVMALLAIAVAGCTRDGLTPPHTITTDLLTRQYDRVVFERDFKGPTARLLKWYGPIRYRLDYEPALVEYAERSRGHFDRLREITGLDIQETESGAYNFHVYIGPRTNFLRHLRRGTPLHASHTNVRCFAQLRTTGSGWIWTARVGIGTDQDVRIVHSCIAEELTQALGLLADTNLIKPSVFNDMLHGSPELMWHDEIIVRAHYDPRMEPGMDRRLARRSVRGIISALMAERETRDN